MIELLRTEGLTKRFRGLVANDNVDFALETGEVRCVIGPNGAGKTTFISMISGHLTPTAGRIWFRGREITELSVARRARLGSRVSSKHRRCSTASPSTTTSSLPPSASCLRRGACSRIEEVLEITRLRELQNVVASALSYGQRQWLEVGMLLANRAELLLLDEPTAGMTAEETSATGELIRMLAGSHNLSLIIIEHDINFIRDLKAPVTVLHLGRVLVHGSFEEVAENERVRNVYLGHA